MKLPTRRLASTLLLILAAASPPCAQEHASETAQTAPAPDPPPFKQLRYEEDYGYLRDERRRTEPTDRLKYIPLNRAGDWYLSVGGELRLRYERFTNDAWGAAPADGGGYFCRAAVSERRMTCFPSNERPAKASGAASPVSLRPYEGAPLS